MHSLGLFLSLRKFIIWNVFSDGCYCKNRQRCYLTRLGLCSAQTWVVILWQLKVSWREAIPFLSVCKMACRPRGFSWVKTVISYWTGSFLSDRSSRRDVDSRRGQNLKELFAKWAQKIIFDCPLAISPLISNDLNYLGYS